MGKRKDEGEMIWVLAEILPATWTRIGQSNDPIRF
jgi:hypothetical protein